MKKTSKTTEKYTVTNVYGISGESNHRTPEAALKAAGKREGEGWIVVDQDGNQWCNNGPDAVIVASAEVQAKAQATRKRKARAARDSHNPTGQAAAHKTEE